MFSNVECRATVQINETIAQMDNERKELTESDEEQSVEIEHLRIENANLRVKVLVVSDL